MTTAPSPERPSAGVVVDSNVLLDVIASNQAWGPWSDAQLIEAFDRGVVVLNPIVYAEVSVTFDGIEALEEALPQQLTREDLPWDAAFLAGKCFAAYRRRGGRRHAPLPDFYIGAHAAVTGRAVLTRDPGPYRLAFPGLKVIAP
jgi:predicted nucleic acid-binding protein